MNYSEEQNEEILNLKGLFLYILRKWRVLIIAMLVGAVLLGIYRAKFKPDVVPLTATQQEDVQDKIEENEELILEYKSNIKINKEKVTENTEDIKTAQAELEIQQELVSDLEYIVSLYSKPGSQNASELANVNVQLAAARKKVTYYETQIESLEQENSEIPKTNSSLQEEIYKLKKDNRELKKSLTSQQFVNAGISSIIKYVILGSFLGIFIICGIMFIEYILYKKLRSEDELRARYNVRVIGNLNVVPEKRNKNKIDKLVNRWSNYSDITDMEKQYKLISSAIQVLFSDKNKEILLTGTIEQSMLDQLSEKLKEVLPQDGYPLKVIANPVYDADALLKIKESIIILVEAKDASDIREIYKLTDILHAGKAEILGAVIL